MKKLIEVGNWAKLLGVEKLVELIRLEKLREKEKDLLLLIELKLKKLEKLRLTNNMVKYKMWL